MHEKRHFESNAADREQQEREDRDDHAGNRHAAADVRDELQRQRIGCTDAGLAAAHIRQHGKVGEVLAETLDVVCIAGGPVPEASVLQPAVVLEAPVAALVRQAEIDGKVEVERNIAVEQRVVRHARNVQRCDLADHQFGRVRRGKERAVGVLREHNGGVVVELEQPGGDKDGDALTRHGKLRRVGINVGNGDHGH